MLKILTCFTIIFLWSIRSYAQFGVGVQLSSVSWIDDQGYTENGQPSGFYSPSQADGFALEGHYIIKPRMRIVVNLEYEFTKNQKTIHDTVLNGQNFEEYVYVKDPAFILRAEFNYAFTHNFVDKGFTFYGLGGFAVNTYTYSSYYGASTTGSNGNTISSNSPTQSKIYSGVSASIGLGIEYAFNQRIILFLDARGCTGATTNFTLANFQSNNPDILPNNFNPGYISSAIGLRYNFGDKKSGTTGPKTK